MNQTSPSTTDTGATNPDIGFPMIPFKVEFQEKSYDASVSMPKLQSFAVATTRNGNWIVSGGRSQGLHTFNPAPVNNFLPGESNNWIFLINPTTGSIKSFDVTKLPDDISAPLQATNQQYYYDYSTDQMYIIGGYGWNVKQTNMLTFPLLMRYSVSAMEAALSGTPTPEQINALIERLPDDRFAVTGGALYKMDGLFYLVFGQRFDQQYRAFGGSDEGSGFVQQYIQEIRIFQFKPGSLEILNYGANTNSEPDEPFHRRDGNITEDVDPGTGKQRITAFGGVFKPGIIGAYTFPICINGPQAPVLYRLNYQKFSQYNCPVVSVYDSNPAKPLVYHTFFGGISHFYFSQTPSQKAAYDTVTQEGRNDGFPFIADITTLEMNTEGRIKEYIQLQPIANNRLLGASIPFILARSFWDSGMTMGNNVINLQQMVKGARTLVGYVYGGIEAVNPLPLAPNTGTSVSNSIFEVYLTHEPYAVRNGMDGIES